MYEHWSTLQIPASRRTQFWRDVVERAFLPMTPMLGRTHDFKAVMTHRHIDRVALNQVQAPAHGMARTAADLNQGGPEVAFLNLYLAGRARLVQGGQEVEAKPGAMLLFDSSAEYGLEQPDDLHLVSLAVPRQALGNSLDRARLPPRCLRPCAPAMLLAAQLRSLAAWQEELNLNEGAAIADVLVGTLRAALDEPQQPAPMQRRNLHPRLRALVEQRYGEPSFSAADAARELGISVRTLHAWLAAEGQRFGAQLLAFRLERAHAMLRLASAQVSVMEVAARCGFVSAAHFARCFRERYGVTARSLRDPD